MIKAGAVDIFNVTHQSGGMWGAARLFALADAAGLQCLISTTQEMSIGTAAVAHRARRSPCCTIRATRSDPCCTSRTWSWNPSGSRARDWSSRTGRALGWRSTRPGWRPSAGRSSSGTGRPHGVAYLNA
jgi:hypothetical protein